jgi:hypothetical protein
MHNCSLRLRRCDALSKKNKADDDDDDLHIFAINSKAKAGIIFSLFVQIKAKFHVSVITRATFSVADCIFTAPLIDSCASAESKAPR